MSDTKIRVIDSKKLIEAINTGSYEINLSAVMALGAVVTQSTSTEATSDWNEMVVVCDCCGHTIHVKRQCGEGNETVPVVRCKDCIYWTPQGSNGGACKFWECQGISSADYCSTGKRKEEANDLGRKD